MSTIWKVILDTTDDQRITVPKGAKFLCIREQHEQVCLWFECDSDAPKDVRRIGIAGTGHEVPTPDGKYLGTAFLMEGQLVLHVYEIGFFE